jgi:hypothetical protein
MFGAGAAPTFSTHWRGCRKTEAPQRLRPGRKPQLRVKDNQRRHRRAGSSPVRSHRVRTNRRHIRHHRMSRPQSDPPLSRGISLLRIRPLRARLLHNSLQDITRRDRRRAGRCLPRRLHTRGLRKLPRKPAERRNLTQHPRDRPNSRFRALGRRNPLPHRHRLRMILTMTRFRRTRWNSTPRPRM